MSQATDKPKRRGRPPINIPVAKIEAFCQIHATDEEIAAHFCCSRRTIARLRKKPAYAQAFEKGYADGKISLRRAQYQEALKGSPSMLIWLGKQLLGQRERFEHTGSNGGPIQLSAVRSMLDNLSEDDFQKLMVENGLAGGGEPKMLPAAQTVVDVAPAPTESTPAPHPDGSPDPE